MREITEQEQLAKLIGGSIDADPVITGDILAEGLKAQLSGVKYSAPVKESSYREASNEQSYVTSEIKYDSAIVSALQDVHNNLICAFSECKLNSPMANTLTSQINKIGSCIVNMGGEADMFEPLNHVSGLKIPDTIKNAQEVISRTIQCYRLGEIKDAKVNDKGNEINIVFEGEEGDTKYTAYGRIIANAWTGNEAIDYVYTPSAGRMSVKSFQGGRWMDKGASDGYHISWELSEDEISNNSAKKLNDKKEVSTIIQNDEIEIQDGEDDIGSPI